MLESATYTDLPNEVFLSCGDRTRAMQDRDTKGLTGYARQNSTHQHREIQVY